MKNWKTTIASVVIAGLYSFLTSLQAGGMTLKDAALAAGIVVLGLLMKDYDVTGGTVDNGKRPQ